MKDIKTLVGGDNPYLKDTIKELYQNKEVVAFIEKNKLSLSDVEDNLIYLMDLQEDHSLCENCHGLEYCAKDFKGHMMRLEYENNLMIRSFIPCRFGKEIAQENTIQRNIVMNHLNQKAFKDARLIHIKSDYPDNTSIDVLSRLADLMDKPIYKGLYLYGKTGVGKTYYMAAFINRMAGLQEDCAIITLNQLSQELKRLFSDRSEEKELYYDKIDILKTVHILVIDSIGSESVSSWLRDEILYTILDERLNSQLPTFFTSIYSLNELEKLYSFNSNDRPKAKMLVDRIKALSDPIELIDRNYRE